MLERVVVSSYRLLGVTSFVLKVMSWSGNNVPIYLYQINVFFSVILVLSREGKVSRHNFHFEMSHPG